MTDIVERLRAVAAMDLRTGGFLAHTLDTAKEAADEIEWLRRARVADLEEIERLRAAKRRALQVAAADEIERLEFEYARADEAAKRLGQKWKERGQEIERLRSMRECTEEQCPYEAQRAEIERLREAKRRALEMADLRSLENVRLRAALREIAQSCRYDENQKAYCQTREATIAQKALASEQKECPNCHNANEHGDYMGPTCPVCLGAGVVEQTTPREEYQRQLEVTRKARER